MRELKLSMHMTVDGFVAGPNGELDWMSPSLTDEKLRNYIVMMASTTDTIIMGRKMTDEFVNYWTDVVKNPDSPEYSLARKMVDIPKIVFTKTLKESRWVNTTLAKGDIVDEVNALKKRDGQDIIVYGGAGFVSSLIKHKLIDEYYLLVSPVAIGKGMMIFGKLESQFNF